MKSDFPRGATTVGSIAFIAISDEVMISARVKHQSQPEHEEKLRHLPAILVNSPKLSSQDIHYWRVTIRFCTLAGLTQRFQITKTI